MYRAWRTAGRPPWILRLPLYWPLSRFMGAKPASAEALVPGSVPNSGITAIKEALTLGPTPVKLWRISQFSCHSGVRRMESWISRSRSLRSWRRWARDNSMLPYSGGAGAPAVLLHNDHALQLAAPGHEIGQFQLFLVLQGAHRGPYTLRIEGQNLGVQLIGLGQFADGFGKWRKTLGFIMTTGRPASYRA